MSLQARLAVAATAKLGGRVPAARLDDRTGREGALIGALTAGMVRTEPPARTRGQ